MNCIFCPTVILEKYADHADALKMTGIISFDYDVYFCNNCSTTQCFLDEQLVTWNFFSKYNEEIFCIEWLDLTNTIRVSKTGTQQGYIKVAILSGNCGITPHNIDKKLPTIIVFS